MKWMFAVAAAISMAGVAAAQNQLRLTEQRAEGAWRVCIYGSGAEAKTRRIGLGEPCPFRYRAPEREMRWVPAMAIRIAEERANGRTVCIYRYAGQVYRAARLALMSCPLTPGPAMEVLTESSPTGGDQR